MRQVPAALWWLVHALRCDAATVVKLMAFDDDVFVFFVLDFSSSQLQSRQTLGGVA